jgi:Sec-independent protein translocase protein TatA
MDILGIGPLELLLILIIALIVLGPSDMVKAGRTIGKFLRQVITSPTWKAVTQTSNEIRRIPNRLIREAGLDEEISALDDIRKQKPFPEGDLEKWQNQISPWTTPPIEKQVEPKAPIGNEEIPDEEESSNSGVNPGNRK